MVRELRERGFALGSPFQLQAAEPALFGNAFYVDPAQPLLHFMPISRFRELVSNRALYLRRLDKFVGDPHEGLFPIANQSEAASWTRHVTEQLGLPVSAFDEYQRGAETVVRKRLYVHCWFGSAKEDSKMWEEYGNLGNGVCIKTTARRLQQALRPNSGVVADVRGVTYLGDDIPLPVGISFLQACRKHPKFSHERETRIIAQLPLAGWPNGKSLDDTEEFLLIETDFERLFEAVFVGACVDDRIADEIEVLANNAAGSRVARRSCIRFVNASEK